MENGLTLTRSTVFRRLFVRKQEVCQKFTEVLNIAGSIWTAFTEIEPVP